MNVALRPCTGKGHDDGSRVAGQLQPQLALNSQLLAPLKGRGSLPELVASGALSQDARGVTTIREPRRIVVKQEVN